MTKQTKTMMKLTGFMSKVQSFLFSDGQSKCSQVFLDWKLLETEETGNWGFLT